MSSSHTYRSTAAVLALVFALFNIGLPVVVASCPMAKYQDRPMCMMCNDGTPSDTVKLRNSVDRSCCETRYAADRNTTEFLHILNAVEKLNHAIAAVASQSLSTVAPVVAEVPYTDSSPPHTRDIPILVSSLLI